ncbi:MAG: ABC transporter substrate-binding protein [Methanothrix sp.]|jgi:iron complex transport system substrate-binding protein|uniref:ABC transporter substrate-binding protein n=3 Tax=Methanothrix TaxID=2222 RepID=UPI001BD22E5F|nr:ABC transporter substrate-binding protein [Methanothrix sp.]MBK7385236.1 ABC transporter substrate-binding protein [Methanothrix sp.]
MVIEMLSKTRIRMLLAWLMLCSLPILAGGFDFTLKIYGNANLDDTIDQLDIDFIQGIINGTEEYNELADANNDGSIDQEDIAQIEDIIAGKEEKLILKDTANRTVSIDMPVERIIVPSGLAAEAFKVLKATDKIVGVSNTIHEKIYFFPDLADRPSVGGWKIEDYEAVISLDPDLVISYEKWPPISEAEENLDPTGIPVVALEFTDPNFVTEELVKLSYILGTNGAEDRYIQWRSGYERQIDEYVNNLSRDERPSVFLETGFKGLNDVGTYGEGAKGSLVLELAGGRNIAANLSEAYPHVDSEWIITENPEVVMKYVYSSEVDWGWNGTDEPEAIVAEVLNRDGWESIDAVKSKRVYLISNELMTGLDSVVGYLYWVKLLHPDFAADPTEAYEEYMTDFMGMEFPDLIFVYPRP